MNYNNIPAVLFQVVTACDVFEDKPENKYSLKNIIDELKKLQAQNMSEQCSPRTKKPNEIAHYSLDSIWLCSNCHSKATFDDVI